MVERNQKVMEYMPLVRAIARSVYSRLPVSASVEYEDLVQVGAIGLMQAVERYDVRKSNGAKFATFAGKRIKGSIQDHLRVLDPASRSLRKMQKRIEAIDKELSQHLVRDVTNADIASALDMPLEEYHKLAQRIDRLMIVDLDAGLDMTLSARIADKKAECPHRQAVTEEKKKLLMKAIGQLPERCRQVLILLYYEGLVQREVGEVLGVGESRVNQIKFEALQRLREVLEGDDVMETYDNVCKIEGCEVRLRVTNRTGYCTDCQQTGRARLHMAGEKVDKSWMPTPRPGWKGRRGPYKKREELVVTTPPADVNDRMVTLTLSEGTCVAIFAALPPEIKGRLLGKLGDADIVGGG